MVFVSYVIHESYHGPSIFTRDSQVIIIDIKINKLLLQELVCVICFKGKSQTYYLLERFSICHNLNGRDWPGLVEGVCPRIGLVQI